MPSIRVGIVWNGDFDLSTIGVGIVWNRKLTFQLFELASSGSGRELILKKGY